MTRIALLLTLLIPAVRAEPIPIEKLIADSVVVDGVANVYSPESGIGHPDFTKDREGRTVKAATGIDIAALSVHDLKQLDRQVILAQRKWKGARIIRTRDDLDACREGRQFGVLLYAKVHFPLKGNSKAVERWHTRGLRIVGLQYAANDRNQTDGERLCGAFDQKGGLTKLGRQVIGECFVSGILVDLSRCNEESTLEAAKLASGRKIPVVKLNTATRGARGKDGKPIADIARNASDAELKAIASTGGVVGIAAREMATVADYVTHIEHAIKVAGIDHVGIATDGYLDGTMANNRRADGVLDSPRRWFAVAKLLRERGTTDDQLKKLLGGNFLRVYRTVLK